MWSIFSPSLVGFSPDTPVSSHSPKQAPADTATLKHVRQWMDLDSIRAAPPGEQLTATLVEASLGSWTS